MIMNIVYHSVQVPLKDGLNSRVSLHVSLHIQETIHNHNLIHKLLMVVEVSVQKSDKAPFLVACFKLGSSQVPRADSTPQYHHGNQHPQVKENY